jgi:hypothetical protein
MDQKQINYVTEELARGVSPEELRTTLLGAGYTDVEIDALLQVVAGGGVPVPGTAVPEAVRKSMSTWVKVLLGIVVGLIAIIALLNGVVLSSLDNARDKATDATDKMTLNNLRGQAEIYYFNGLSYKGFCDSSAFTTAAANQSNLDCVDSVDAYRVNSILQDSTNYCIDNTGYAEVMLTPPAEFSCEPQEQIDDTEESNTLGLQKEENLDRADMQSDQGDTQNLLFMRTTIELYYNENDFSYSDFCDSTVGRSALEDIEGVECFAAGPAYRVSKEMVSGGYYCIDGTGTAGIFDAQPVGLSC